MRAKVVGPEVATTAQPSMSDSDTHPTTVELHYAHGRASV